MKKVKRKEIFLLITIHVLLFGIACIFLILYNHFSYQKFSQDVNYWVGGVIKTIQEKYPEVTEAELITLLNTYGSDNELLDKLGIREENIAILPLEKRKGRTFVVGFLTLLVLEFLVILFTLYIYFRENRNINNIVNYVKEINKKNYTLEIEEHGESELSILKSELYKITVMLKEESESAKDEKLYRLILARKI